MIFSQRFKNLSLYFPLSPLHYPHQPFFSMASWVTILTHSDTCWPIRSDWSETRERSCTHSKKANESIETNFSYYKIIL